MTDMTHKPGNLSCDEVRDCLSDVIDARRGEIPHPDGTRLSESGIHPAIELHLAACSLCRQELAELEQVGFAFADFSVNEVPAQHFENYAQIVRARMTKQERNEKTANASVIRPRRNFWLRMAASAAAAACLALLVVPQVEKKLAKQPALSKEVRTAMRELRALHKEQFTAPVDMEYMTPQNFNGTQMYVSQQLTHDPRQPSALNKMRQDEGRYGYLVVGERTGPGERPLLGAYLKTTRDVDRVVNSAKQDEGETRETASNVNDVGGLMVYEVIPGSPAYNMGLRKNDRIVTINGMGVNTGGAEEAATFFAAIRELGDAAPLTLHVIRPVGGQYLFMKPMDSVLGQYTR